MIISYSSLFKFLITFDGSSRDIEDVNVFFRFETLFLKYDTTNDIKLRADHKNNFISLRSNSLSRIQLNNIDDSCWSSFHHKSKLFDEPIIKVHGLFSFNLKFLFSMILLSQNT